MTDQEKDRQHGPSGLDAVPGLARVAARGAWHATEWTMQTSVKAGRRLLQAAVNPASALDLAQEVGEAAAAITPIPMPERPPPISADANGQLRRLGEELMHRSRDVRYEEAAHPAYERIILDLTPDEGRILRLLLTDGPQPTVDVRTGGPLGFLRSELIAPGLNMIGARAGCRYVDRVPAYLHNLFRLGLIWFSRETLPDAHRYQVIEAQPDVLAAIHSVRFAKIVRRSIHLTPFGIDFCRVCLALDVDGTALPAHHAPKEAASAPQLNA